MSVSRGMRIHIREHTPAQSIQTERQDILTVFFGNGLFCALKND